MHLHKKGNNNFVNKISMLLVKVYIYCQYRVCQLLKENRSELHSFCLSDKVCQTEWYMNKYHLQGH